jgi:ribonuclease Z
VLGHYSTRYESIEAFKKEATEIFDSVHLADDGKVLRFE